MLKRSLLMNTDKECKAYQKALNRWYKDENQAMLATIYSANDGIASSLGNLITEIVKHNGSARCYDEVSQRLTRCVFDLMREPEED